MQSGWASSGPCWSHSQNISSWRQHKRVVALPFLFAGILFSSSIHKTNWTIHTRAKVPVPNSLNGWPSSSRRHLTRRQSKGAAELFASRMSFTAHVNVASAVEFTRESRPRSSSRLQLAEMIQENTPASLFLSFFPFWSSPIFPSALQSRLWNWGSPQVLLCPRYLLLQRKTNRQTNTRARNSNFRERNSTMAEQCTSLMWREIPSGAKVQPTPSVQQRLCIDLIPPS